MTQESLAVRDAFLPREAPTVSGYDVAGGTATHENGRGDTLWDHFVMADGRAGFVVFKATAGSVPAGFFVALGRALFRGLAPTHDDVASLMASVNRTMTLGAPEVAGQALECGVAVPSPEEIEWSSAGHPPGGIIGREGTFTELPSQGPPMGVMEGFRYHTSRHPMNVGDSCVTLSHASPGLFKGTADLVAGLVGKPAGEVVSTVHRAIRQAQGDEAEVSVVFLRRG